MQQIYKIDQTKIKYIRKRILLRNVKVIVISILILSVPPFFQDGVENFKIYGLSFLISGPLIFLVMSFGVGKLIKSYKTLEIILDNQGVELKAEMTVYKKIEWINLKIEEKSNGVINLYETNISTFSRMMNGKGWIQIQPEINNREQLLNELYAHRI